MSQQNGGFKVGFKRSLMSRFNQFATYPFSLVIRMN